MDHTSFPLLQAVKEQSSRASSPTTTKISPHSSLVSLQTFLSICGIFKRTKSPCKCFPIVSRAIKFVFREIWQVCFAESPALFSLRQAPFHQVFSSYWKSSFLNRSLYSAWPDNSCIANHRKTGRENRVWTMPDSMTKVTAGDRAASREHLEQQSQAENRKKFSVNEKGKRC